MSNINFKYLANYYYYEMPLDEFLNIEQFDNLTYYKTKYLSFDSYNEAEDFFIKETNLCNARIVCDKYGNKNINFYRIEFAKISYVLGRNKKTIEYFDTEVIDKYNSVLEDYDLFNKVICQFFMKYYSSLINEVVNWCKPNNLSIINKELITLKKHSSHSNCFVDCLNNLIDDFKYSEYYEDLDLIKLLNTTNDEFDKLAWEIWEYTVQKG